MKRCTICNSKLQGNQRKYCSNNCKQKSHYLKIKEQHNTMHSQTSRAISRKLEFIKLKGGECQECGYKKNIAALEFHHLNAEFKVFALNARNLSNTNPITLKKELDKCILLCANCHRELHNPDMGIDSIKIVVKPKPFVHTCTECGGVLDKKPKTGLCRQCLTVEQRKGRPDYETLMQSINTLGYCGTGRKYGVSDNAIRKWEKFYIKTK